MTHKGNKPGQLSAGTMVRQGHRLAIIDEPPQKVDNKAIAVAAARIVKTKGPALAKYGTKTKNKAKKLK